MNNLVVKEYLGNGIEFKIVDGYVYANANRMAETFGGSNQLKHWKDSPNTKRYLEALKSKLGEICLVKSEEGRYGGTWIHEKLILNFARYLNVEFELWCDEQIETLLREGEITLSSKDKLLLDVIKADTEMSRAVAINNYESNYVKPLEIENKQQKEYIDHVVINQKYYITPTQIGNKFDMSATKLNKVLNNIGVIYKKGEKWYLTSDYYGIGDYGYFQKPNGEWEKGTSLRYSNEGEKKIYEILVLHGYEPVKTVA